MQSKAMKKNEITYQYNNYIMYSRAEKSVTGSVKTILA